MVVMMMMVMMVVMKIMVVPTGVWTNTFVGHTIPWAGYQSPVHRYVPEGLSNHLIAPPLWVCPWESWSKILGVLRLRRRPTEKPGAVVVSLAQGRLGLWGR